MVKQKNNNKKHKFFNTKNLLVKLLIGANKLVIHPVAVFIILQAISIAITVLWVVWYVNQTNFAFGESEALGFLIAGMILLGLLFIGIVLLFIYFLKQRRLNIQQRGFVSSVTHELRSPIASMQLSVETLQQRELDSKTAQKLYQMIARDLDRLMDLVDQILVSARLDRGIKLFTDIERFFLKAVIADVIADLSHIDSQINQRTQVFCPEDLMIKAPKPAIRLILKNLLENAIKYSNEGTPIVVTAHLDPKGDLLIKVQDQGVGLEVRNQRQVFKQFFRGDQALKAAIPGTGLGLYIVRSICKTLGGRTWVTSEGRNRGSTFYVQIPISH